MADELVVLHCAQQLVDQHVGQLDLIGNVAPVASPRARRNFRIKASTSLPVTSASRNEAGSMGVNASGAPSATSAELGGFAAASTLALRRLMLSSAAAYADSVLLAHAVGHCREGPWQLHRWV